MLLRAADLLQSPLVTELSLYDIVHAPGVAIDLNHIDTPGKVTGYLPRMEVSRRRSSARKSLSSPPASPENPA